jgi:hypothetical protein
MNKRLIALPVGLLAAASLAAGCGSSGSDHSKAGSVPAAKTSSTSTTAAMGGTETGAATLRAGLTSLLQEHVYLAGAAVDAGAGKGLDSPEFKAAAATLDTNSVDLSKAIGSVYGDAAGTKFLALWRKHIGFFVDYTKGLATHDQKAADAAQSKLDGYRAQFAAFLQSANPNAKAGDVSASLQEHVRTLSAAIRSVVGKKTDAFAKLRVAAQHMPMTADYLAGAIAKQKPGQFDGDVDSQASELRSGLTNLLQEHVYLAGFAVKTGVSAGLTSPAFKAAAATLDTNTVDLSKAIGSVYGDAAAEKFLKLWRGHIGFFVDYTKGLAGHDRTATAKALHRLDGYRAEFSRFLASANPNIKADDVAASLQEHVKTLSAAIRSVVSGNGDVYMRLRHAAQHMPMTADYLAKAIAEQKKLS